MTKHLEFRSDLQQKSINDDDQESGTGNSIPHSPVRDHENSYVDLFLDLF